MYITKHKGIVKSLLPYKILRALSLSLLFFSLAAPIYFIRNKTDHSVPFVFLAFAVIFLSYNFFMFSKRKIASLFNYSPVQWENLALYLRSFKYDKDYSGSEFLAYLGSPIGMLFNSSFLRTKEENIAMILKRENLVMFSIRNPKSNVTEPGSLKFSSDNWMQDVSKGILLSKIILLNAGLSNGTRWEFDEILRRRMLHKTFIILSNNESDYYQFKLYFRTKTSVTLPDFSQGEDCVLIFDKSNNAYIVKHAFSYFSNLPKVAFALKRGLQFASNNFKITNPSFQVKLGALSSSMHN